MNDETGIYITKCRMFINLMLSYHQWSGIDKSDVERWISNFSDSSQEEQCLMYKLLTNLIYFSEKDVVSLLQDGIYNHLFKKIILQKQIENKFQLSTRALMCIVEEEIQKTCFIPLLDSEAPHESGNYISRLLVQKEIIGSHQSIFLNSVVEKVAQYGFKRIVIVDDCMGSGDQLSDSWNEKASIIINDESVLLKDWCKTNNIEVNYLILFGYDKNLDFLQKTLPDVKIYCIKLLNEIHRVFNDDSYIWENVDEKNKAESFFDFISKENGIKLYGHSGLDFAFIMHQTIPDWSLPIFWKVTPDWKCLLRRKNS